MMKKRRNEFLEFVVGILLLVVGLYWFMSSVTVTSGFFGMMMGGFRVGGLVVVPFLVGIVWMFINTEAILAKVVAILGFILIIASIIASTTFIFRSRTLYEYLLMLVFIFGGLGLIMRVLFAKPKNTSNNQPDPHSRIETNKTIEEELEELKRNNPS